MFSDPRALCPCRVLRPACMNGERVCRTGADIRCMCACAHHSACTRVRGTRSASSSCLRLGLTGSMCPLQTASVSGQGGFAASGVELSHPVLYPEFPCRLRPVHLDRAPPECLHRLRPADQDRRARPVWTCFLQGYVPLCRSLLTAKNTQPEGPDGRVGKIIHFFLQKLFTFPKTWCIK